MKHFFKIGFFVALAIAAVGSVTMLLWNFIVPELFNGPIISFWQALGLLLLSKILFGGWKKGWGRHYHGGKHHYWKKKMEERMMKMTDEEKEKFKMRFAHCGWNDLSKETK